MLTVSRIRNLTITTIVINLNAYRMQLLRLDPALSERQGSRQKSDRTFCLMKLKKEKYIAKIFIKFIITHAYMS